MKNSFLAPLFVAAFIAPAALYADATPADDVKAAVKKLTEASGYSWKTTTTVPDSGNNRFRPGPVEGKTEKDGYTCIAFSGREDSKIEGIMKGDKVAVKGQDGAWKTPEEMAAGRGDGAGGGGGGNGERRGPGRGFGGRMFQNVKAPAAQAEDLAGKAKDLKKADDAISGDLPEDAVKQMLTFGGRGGRDGGNGPEIKDPKGSVKFWVKEGALAKMEVHVSGSMSFNGNDRAVDRTTTTEISGVGSTKVEVPEEAKKKLEGAAKESAPKEGAAK